MSKPIKLTGQVNKGKIYLDDIKLQQHVLNGLEGVRIEIRIQEEQKNPTTKQYGYWHEVLLPVALSSEVFGGWEKREVDRFLTKKFLGETKIKEINGIPTEIDDTPSKATISRKAFTELIEQSIVFLNQQGIEVPEPTFKKKYHDTNNAK